MKIKFKNRLFNLMEKIIFEDGTVELWLKGTRDAEYKATLPKGSEHWQLVYNSAYGKRSVLRFDKKDYQEFP